jgi:hypothetical protein
MAVINRQLQMNWTSLPGRKFWIQRKQRNGLQIWRLYRKVSTKCFKNKPR